MAVQSPVSKRCDNMGRQHRLAISMCLAGVVPDDSGDNDGCFVVTEQADGLAEECLRLSRTMRQIYVCGDSEDTGQDSLLVKSASRPLTALIRIDKLTDDEQPLPALKTSSATE